MSESIKELRDICQNSREDEFYQFGWFEKNIIRKVSIYFTKVFIILKLSANQVTFLGLLVGIAAGILLTFGDTRFWLIGFLLLYIFQILDVIDGEIARYNKTACAKGAFWDGMNGLFTWQFTLACASFGIYRALNEVMVLVFGFAIVILLFLYIISTLWPYSILTQEGLLFQPIKDKPGENFTGIQKYGRAIFGQGGGLFHGFLVASIMDWFLPPFAIAGFPLNFRFIYFIAYLVALLVAVGIKIYNIQRGELMPPRSLEMDE